MLILTFTIPSTGYTYSDTFVLPTDVGRMVRLLAYATADTVIRVRPAN